MLENGAFRKSYVQTERDTVRKKLESIVNDKIRYAAERCIEVMCKNEPYRLHPLGERKDLDGITPEGLYESYQNWLNESVLDLYVVGDTSLDEVKKLVEEHFKLNRTGSKDYVPSTTRTVASETQTVVEKLDINQGKLNMGLRSTITYGDDEYAAALMYNGILGSYPHSKLFVNVREKESLAYYASSRYDGHKGIATIQSGIEVQNFEKAVQIIRQQLDDMAKGAITDIEMTQTKAMIRNVIKEMQDSAFEMIAYDFNRTLSGRERTPDELLQQVEGITVDDVKQAAAAFSLDTIYFLKGQKEE